MAFGVVSNELISSQTCAVLRLTTAFVLLLFFLPSVASDFQTWLILLFYTFSRSHTRYAPRSIYQRTASRGRERERGYHQAPSKHPRPHF